MELCDKFLLEWDDNLECRNENFGELLHQESYDPDKAREDPFPNDHTLAIFAKMAYPDHKLECPVDWKLLTEAWNMQTKNGYFGAAYWNPILCQVVITHRGTKSFAALYNDMKLACNKYRCEQSESAATFVHKVREQLTDERFKNGPPFHVSITGHSLGAWLAQITTFTIKYLTSDGQKFKEDPGFHSNVHPHTVAFESPGCHEALAKMVKHLHPYLYLQRKFGNYNILDMTVYLSKLNPINVINKHVGTIFMVKSNTHWMDDILKLFDKETHNIEKEMVLHFKSGVGSATKRFFEWVLPINLNKNLIKRVHDSNICSLNVFDEEELDFVKDWISCSKHSLACVAKFQAEHSLFLNENNINYDYHTIESDNLSKIIGRIKHLRPSKNMIIELLRKDIPDLSVLLRTMLKLETEQYQDTLQLSGCYFKDKYGLYEFLQMNDSILHVNINEECTKYDFECSIVNYIVKSYTTRYYFIKWSKLDATLKYFPNVINIDEVDLLIVDCFEIEEENHESILEFLRNKTKIVVLSFDKYSWKQDIDNIKEVVGYGSSLNFHDLTEERQEQFINQKMFQLNKRSLSLKDIINVSLPLSEEILKRINKVVPFKVLLELLSTPTNDPILMDCPPANILNPFIFSELYDEIELDSLQNRTKENELFVIEDPEEHLNIQRQNFIINREINYERECLESPDKTIYFFTIKEGKLYLHKIFDKKFYIQRYLTARNVVNPTIFTSITETSDKFFFTGNENKFHELNKEKRQFFEFLSPKSDVKSKEQNQHFLNVEENAITWTKSQRSIEVLYKYILPQKKSIIEQDLIKNQSVTVIKGKAGSGKSSTIARLYLELLDTYWVFALELKNALFNEITPHINFDIATKFIVYSSNISYKECVQHLLSYCLKYKTTLPVYLLFDGFDELLGAQRKKLIDLLNFLKNSSTAKILITTQNFRSRQLENELCLFSSSYEKIDRRKEIESFFMRFWYVRWILFDETVNKRQLIKFAKNMLDGAENTLGEDIYKLISLPLHIRMIGKIVKPGASVTFVNILQLFENYVHSHYTIYFNKKGVNDAVIIKWLSKQMDINHCKLAIAKLQPNTVDMEYAEMIEFNRIGLIHSELDYILCYEFQHNTVCDYFIAYLTLQWLKPQSDVSKCDIENFIVSDLLVNPKHKEIRLFLNLMLKDPVISDRQLEICRYNFEPTYNDLQEAAYHICARENLLHLTEFFLQNVIGQSDRTELLSKRNTNDETPLYLVVSMLEGDNQQNMMNVFLRDLQEWSQDDIKMTLLATFFVYFITDQHMDTFATYAQEFQTINEQMIFVRQNFKYVNKYLDACKYDNMKKVKTMLERFNNDALTKRYLLLSTNERKESGLHLTSSKEIANMLLSSGINKDLQDHHGMTPLNRAIKNNKADVAEKLIENNAAITLDAIGNSPLMHAVKYGHFSLVKLLLNPKKPGSKCDVNQRNTFKVTPLMMATKTATKDTENIVRYLLERQAKVNLKDCNGMSAFFHAVKAENRNLMRILKQKNADINVQDVDGITPLLYSIMRRHWNTVQSLFSYGADVNIGNKRGEYPLQMLIKMKEGKMIKRILAEQQLESGIIRSGANIDHLNKDELLFIRNLLDTGK